MASLASVMVVTRARRPESSGPGPVHANPAARVESRHPIGPAGLRGLVAPETTAHTVTVDGRSPMRIRSASMPSPRIRELASDLRFPEGPVALPDGSVLVVEIAGGTVTRVAADGRKTVVARPGGGPNGAALGPDGKLYVTNNGGSFTWHELGGLLVPGPTPVDHPGGRIERIDIDTGKVEVLYDRCDGRVFRGPNDLVFDSTGGFWSTDHGTSRERERDRTGVFYARADGTSIREALFPLDAPNGVGLSPDQRRLYVAETHTGRVWCWDLPAPGE